MRTIVLGGGTGFIGSTLKRVLEKNGYQVAVVSSRQGGGQLTWSQIEKGGLPKNVTAVINVAGRNVLDLKKRFTKEFQDEIIESRVGTTKIFSNAINNASQKPNVFITISGVGIYKANPLKVYTEHSPLEERFDFISGLAQDWEAAAKLSSGDVRQVVVRSGAVLGRGGGIIKQIYWPFFLGTGGVMGTGKQPFPWIHLHDLCRIFLLAIENTKVNGVLNGVAPELATNRDFTKAFGRALYRPTIFPLPSFVVKQVFGKERAEMVLDGPKVTPRRLVEEFHFKFMYPDLNSACKEVAPMFYKPPELIKL